MEGTTDLTDNFLYNIVNLWDIFLISAIESTSGVFVR